jgi:hypothetical protein
MHRGAGEASRARECHSAQLRATYSLGHNGSFRQVGSLGVNAAASSSVVIVDGGRRQYIAQFF